jgi:hypothetical protein
LFISIGDPSNFTYFRGETLDGKNYDHINLTVSELHNLGNTPDSDLYELIVTPNMVEWMNK